MLSGKEWYRAEILAVQGKEFKIHYTEDTRTRNDKLVSKDHVRPFEPVHLPKGTKVKVKDPDDKWQLATVLEAWESLHLCRYDGKPAAYDEWIGASRMRR